ncbi:5-formyltetrahydrofolate cyclo-ligase [Yeosuana aromativorans]|uniref:5-formyltetrahydrofolate cyclo-ligase n=1 Tax=Yeosuana aromativorans TaxID=288019 RepID=A0A8J3BLV1_9FLAO|nr:5-formyltetrahydrofolate cyclo-ligase [Yeosuana aromativorans]GGK23767.1 5-formyltetrahydrofolate cyclo-ligase [Yeosuana aromativorans]
MTKAELRKKYKILREGLSSNQVDNLSIAIANQLLKLPIWEYTYYHLFLSIEEKKEVNTDYILNILSGKDKNIVVSKSDFKSGTMTNYLLTDNTVIKKNSYHIPEPIDGIEIPSNKLEVVFVPLLAFDNHGNRVGYGKGFYDRFLSKCTPEIITVGLSFFEVEDSITDIHKDDVTLNYCVTPKTIYRF